jgi:hypothetical protein
MARQKELEIFMLLYSCALVLFLQNKANRQPSAGNLKHEALNPKQVDKTNPIDSYCVLRAAYCVNEVDKTKPISIGLWLDY